MHPAPVCFTPWPRACLCTGELITQVAAMAAAQPALEGIVIEVTGVGEVLPVAAAFFAHERAGHCSDAASTACASGTSGY